MALQDRGNGDGYLGQATRDGQQDDPAERFAEVQTVIEGVRGPGKGRTGEPGGHPADEEHRDEGRTGESAHSILSLRAGARLGSRIRALETTIRP